MAVVVDITGCRTCARLRLILRWRDYTCTDCDRLRFEQAMAQAKLTTMARHNAAISMLVGAALVVAGVALIAMAVAR